MANSINGFSLKKGDRKDSKNYRDITLLYTAIYYQVDTKSIKPTVEKKT